MYKIGHHGKHMYYIGAKQSYATCVGCYVCYNMMKWSVVCVTARVCLPSAPCVWGSMLLTRPPDWSARQTRMEMAGCVFCLCMCCVCVIAVCVSVYVCCLCQCVALAQTSSKGQTSESFVLWQTKIPTAQVSQQVCFKFTHPELLIENCG